MNYLTFRRLRRSLHSLRWSGQTLRGEVSNHVNYSNVVNDHAPAEGESPAESGPVGLPEQLQTRDHRRVPNPRIKILASSANVVRRFSYVGETDRTPLLIDDREVVAMLAAIGRPTGSIRSRDGVRLTRSIVDPPLDASPSRGERQSNNEAGGSL